MDKNILLGSIILLVVALVLGLFLEFRRGRVLRRVAKRLGLEFRENLDWDFPQKYEFLDRLSEGRDKYSQNLLQGGYRSNRVSVFDFSCIRGFGRLQSAREFSMIIMHMGTSLPELTITTDGLFSKIAQMMGREDIDFDSKRFSSRYEVRSTSEEFARDVCNARMIEYLLQAPVRYLEIEGSCLALGYKSRLSPKRIEPELDHLTKIRSLIPEHLFET